MKIKFELETLGYITASFFDGDRKIKILHSDDYGDGFQELLNNLFFIYDVVINNQQQYYPYSFETQWRDHFIIFSWNVSIESPGANLIVQVNELSPANSGYKVELINTAMSFKELFDEIYSSLDDIFNRFGFVGYKKNWGVGNFPAFEYITLKSNALGLNLTDAKYSNEEEEWKGKVDAGQEANILNFSYKNQ